jgi:16S rRNA (adenine1518-N6/adenine1519-N6)-dimethyltransferase
MKKSLGQHFIFDTNMLKKIITCSDITSADTVVEIGPGLGTLTKLLAVVAQKIIAIEYDRKLINSLKKNLLHCRNVEIIGADALKFPFETIEGKFKVCANIPYYITTPLIFGLLEYREKIISMTLLLQKEVAKRIVASPGSKDYGVLSISAQLYTEPELKFTVSRKVFSPPPEVDSAVVYFRVCPENRFNIINEELFMQVVKTAFSQRRKTIINSLKSFEGIRDALQEAGIDPKLRPEMLSIEDFSRLTRALSN